MKVEVHCSYQNRFFRISFVLTSNVRLIKLFNENIKMLEKNEKFEIKPNDYWRINNLLFLDTFCVIFLMVTSSSRIIYDPAFSSKLIGKSYT